MAAGRDEVVGRKAELSVLQSFLEDLLSGPAALVVAGEAGVGKTTLWRDGLRTARERGYRVLACQPVESEAKRSFAALGDLFGAVVEEDDVQWLDAPTSRVLAFALRRMAAEVVGVMVTARSGGDDEAVPLGLDRFLPEGRFRRPDVGPL